MKSAGSMRFDEQDLSLFVAIVRSGSITRGAANSNLSLAAASARVRNMEAALGTQLLVRGRQGAAATAAGRTLETHAAAMIEQARRLREDLAIYAPGVSGQVRLLSNTNAVSEFLPDLLGSFLKTHPHIDIRLEEHTSERIVGLLAEGVADIGILSSSAGVERLRSRFFRDDRYVLVTPKGHKLAKHRSVLLAGLKEEGFVAGPSHGLIVQEAERLGIRPRIRVRVDSFDAVCRLVACGAGVGIVPESAAARSGPRPSLAVVALRDAWAGRRLLLCVRNTERLSVSAKALFDHLANVDRGSHTG
jgi:molybdate transport repressor ModE-like protein